MATPGGITPNATDLPGVEDGGLADREKLEEKHAKAIKAAFDEVLRQVVPRGTREESITPELAMQRYREHGGVLRDALVAMLQETGLAGAAMGRAQVEAILGVGSPRRTNVQETRRRRRWHVQAAARVGTAERYNDVRIVATDWELVNQAVLAWVLGGHGEFGTGYGNSLAAALAQTSEGLIRSLIAEWIQNGAPLRELIAALEATVFSRERAELISITEVTRAYAVGNVEAWRASGIIAQRSWQTAADERVCPICGPLQGQVRGLDEEFEGGLMSPPAHPKCLLPGNLVVTPGFIEAAAKSFYDGPAVEIRLASGRKLAVTEQHPVLTRHGWVAAKLLREGDDVLRCLDGERVATLIDPDDDHMPTLIEEIYETLLMSSDVTAVSVPVAAEDLHGDGRRIHGDIEIIGTHRLLVGNGQSGIREPLSHERFIGRRLGDGLTAQGIAAEFIKADDAPARCPMCGGDLTRALGIGHLRPFDGLSLGLTTNFDAITQQVATHGKAPDAQGLGQGILGFARQVAGSNFVHVGKRLEIEAGAVFMDAAGFEAAGDSLMTDTPLQSEFIDRFAGLIATDEIVEIRHFDYTGHVYDLQVNPYSLFFAEGVIVQNCRCWVSPVVE